MELKLQVGDELKKKFRVLAQLLPDPHMQIENYFLAAIDAAVSRDILKFLGMQNQTPPLPARRPEDVLRTVPIVQAPSRVIVQGTKGLESLPVQGTLDNFDGLGDEEAIDDEDDDDFPLELKLTDEEKPPKPKPKPKAKSKAKPKSKPKAAAKPSKKKPRASATRTAVDEMERELEEAEAEDLRRPVVRQAPGQSAEDMFTSAMTPPPKAESPQQAKQRSRRALRDPRGGTGIKVMDMTHIPHDAGT